MAENPVLTFMAHKGGVGRTLITLQLAGAIAERFKVLIVDQDCQASISKNLFGKSRVENLRVGQTVAAVYHDEPFDPDALIHRTDFDNMWIVPTSSHMSPFDLPPTQKPDSFQFRLKQFVEAVRHRFDMVLIDTAPNIHNLPGVSALNASDCVVTIFEPDKNAVESIADVKSLVGTVMQTTNPDLYDLGCLLTNATKREVVDQAAELMVRRLHGTQVFETVLWRRTKLRQSKWELKPQTLIAPRSEEAKMFRRLLVEILTRMEQRISAVNVTLTANE